MPPARPNRLLHRLFRAPVYLYRWRCGWLLGRRFLLLTHTGRHTGQRHQTVLEVMEFRKPTDEAIVMSGWGRNANWLRNIETDAAAPEITTGGNHFIATYRRLETTEAATVIADYERRNRLLTPILHTVLSRLIGWRYDGSSAARRRLAEQLPLIAFQPRPVGRPSIPRLP